MKFKPTKQPDFRNRLNNTIRRKLCLNLNVEKYTFKFFYIKETMKSFIPCLILRAHNLRNIITFYSAVSRSQLISTIDRFQKVPK